MKTEIPEDVRRNMRDKGIDVDLTKQILTAYNTGEYDSVEPTEVSEIPEIDGTTIVDRRGEASLTVDATAAHKRAEPLLPGLDLDALATRTGNGTLTFKAQALREIGVRLYPRLSYGVLNGGSATSYADETKNRGFDEELFEFLKEDFTPLAELCEGKAKGITPAFVNPDGSHGPSFMQLKMRSMLIHALAYEKAQTKPDYPEFLDPTAPLFQMTSVYNTEQIADAYAKYRDSPFLAPLIEHTGIDVTAAETGVQPLIAAFTQGRPKKVFTNADGKEGEALPLPGGHGQNFAVLKDVYRRLHRSGKRFVYLGNVDNVGFTIDPVGLAYLALTGKQAAFDFSYRTAVDVKGGILVRDQHGRLNCADIGPAISKEEVFRAEAGGKPILFNCATGLFDLSYLVEHIDEIIRGLPMRVSDQNKDAGRYSQAEQVSWEVISMLDDFLVYAVDKWDRFLAAKMLLETLMTSGIKLDDPNYPASDDPAADLRGTAEKLHGGLQAKLQTEYGLELVNGRWEPKRLTDL